MRQSLLIAVVLLLVSGSFSHGQESWPQFRGPNGQGSTDVVGLPLEWSEQHNVIWKSEIPGKGWSSPVIADGNIWLTTATEIKASEALHKSKSEGTMMGDALSFARSITLWALQVDLKEGEVLRKVRLFDIDFPQPIHSLNSYASPTPVLDAGKLYCHFGDYGTACLDAASGEILWQNRLSNDHRVGPGSSPVRYENLLILTCDGAFKQYVVALDCSNGKIVWQTERPPVRTTEPEFRKAFSTPLLIEVAGESQLVIPAAQWCIAYQPRTGKDIWRVDHGRGFSVVPRPVFDGRHLFFCTGYGTQELWAIRPEGRGDVTYSHVAWKRSKQIPTMTSPVLVDGLIYTISDSGVARCFDASSGEPIWIERVGGGFSASPLAADSRIYFCSYEGRTTVIAPGDQFVKLATNELDGKIMASPVVAEGDLLLRTDKHLYRLGE